MKNVTIKKSNMAAADPVPDDVDEGFEDLKAILLAKYPNIGQHIPSLTMTQWACVQELIEVFRTGVDRVDIYPRVERPWEVAKAATMVLRRKTGLPGVIVRYVGKQDSKFFVVQSDADLYMP